MVRAAGKRCLTGYRHVSGCPAGQGEGWRKPQMPSQGIWALSWQLLELKQPPAVSLFLPQLSQAPALCQGAGQRSCHPQGAGSPARWAQKITLERGLSYPTGAGGGGQQSGGGRHRGWGSCLKALWGKGNARATSGCSCSEYTQAKVHGAVHLKSGHFPHILGEEENQKQAGWERRLEGPAAVAFPGWRGLDREKWGRALWRGC